MSAPDAPATALPTGWHRNPEAQLLVALASSQAVAANPAALALFGGLPGFPAWTPAEMPPTAVVARRPDGTTLAVVASAFLLDDGHLLVTARPDAAAARVDEGQFVSFD